VLRFDIFPPAVSIEIGNCLEYELGPPLLVSLRCQSGHLVDVFVFLRPQFASGDRTHAATGCGAIGASAGADSRVAYAI
jgi:hypothetical protein